LLASGCARMYAIVFWRVASLMLDIAYLPRFKMSGDQPPGGQPRVGVLPPAPRVCPMTRACSRHRATLSSLCSAATYVWHATC
jgi:hypothetical protein